MKFICIPLFMILVLTQSFSKWVVMIEYNMNRNFIAKNLCINKVKPKSHCKGKCQMMKQLAEEEKQNSRNNSNPSKIKIQEQVFTDWINKATIAFLTCVMIYHNEHPAAFKYEAPVSSIFHPPSIS